MKKATKILIVCVLSFGIGLLSFADRGGFVKKNKPEVNIETHGTLKNSIQFNLKSGLKYKGSDILNFQKIGNSIVAESIVTYKKGNTTYLIPFKQKIAIPEYTREGGYKLILRSK